MEGLLEVEEFRLTLGLNQHAYLSMKLLVNEENADDYVNLASVLPVKVCEKAAVKGQILFQGKLENVSIQKERGLWYLHLDAYSYTKDWERVDRSRSFLDGSMTYVDVAKKVLSGYGRGDIIDKVSGGEKIPEMLLQYEESDWVFLRRLCSHFGGYLMTDAADSCGRVYFGTPDNRYGTKLDRQDYVLVKDLLHYARVLEPEGILSQEVTGWKIRCRSCLRMWETLLFNGVEAVVTAMDLHTEKGELVCGYELSRKTGLRRERERNPRIFGMSIPATVKERSGNRVRVHFDIDPVYEACSQMKYFTYAIESSSIYCMPEVGSRVQVYFPEHDEQSAVAVHAVRE
ncbi:MAG: sugar-binding protein, partial [Lachnospiraceae bacterium]|nr:sugar-binding protein [Lachnospiraceae bacterium]